MNRKSNPAFLVLLLCLVAVITGAEPQAIQKAAGAADSQADATLPRGVICHPAADAQSCAIMDCPDGVSKCRPRCVKMLATGEIEVVECDCRSGEECYVLWAAGTPPFCNTFCPPGQVCERTEILDPDTGDLTICCDCQPTTECGPESNGLSCRAVDCPNPAEQCIAKCIVINQGVVSIDECVCQSPDECHVSWVPGTPPQCAGGCPPGMVCEQQVTTTPTGGTRICCVCVPDVPQVCEPTPDHLACEPVVCPTAGEVCRAKCLRIGPNGQHEIIDCNCQPDDECYLDWVPGLPPRCLGDCPPGMVCEQSETFDPFTNETIICCNCVPDEPKECQVNAEGTDCVGLCPDGTPFACRASKLTENPATGEITVERCGCDCWLRRSDTPPFEFIGCVGKVCKETGQPCQMVVTQNGDGTITYDCCQEAAVCEPEEDGQSCKQVECPNPASEMCMPKCVFVAFDGTVTIDECECRSPNECHVFWQPGADPFCEGGCPPGYVCQQQVFTTPEGTRICCECVIDPPSCEPTEDRQNCKPFICPNPEETCRPRCVRYLAPGGGLPGYTEILDCVCRHIEECHVVQIGGAAPSCEGFCPPGMFCARNIVQNPDGSVDICCDCVAPECDCPGDVNGDGVINGLDIAGFVRCLLGNPLPGDNCTCADINNDGLYNVLDIQLFIQLLFDKVLCTNTECCPREDLTLNLATGVDGNGNLIPVGNDDDDWIVTVDASGGTVPRPATIVSPHPNWLTIPGTQWVSADYFGPNGDYAYDFCFCLDDRFKYPTLTIQLRADDACTVYLNGNFLGFGASFGAATPVTLTTNNASFFQAGENCLRVEVQNIGGAPTGINLAGTVTAKDGVCCCPADDLDKDIHSGVEDGTGNLIPFGQDDDTWVVTTDASGGSVPRPATVITPHPAWLTIPGTRWISAAQTGPNGDYVYEHCFCLDPRFKNAALSLFLRADDYATVWLNGVQVGATPPSYSFNSPQPTHVFVTNQALFKPCENCIEIVVTNSHGVVTGVNVAATITAEDGLCCDDRVLPQLSCCMPDGSCVDLKPGDDRCPIGGTLMLGPCETPQPCCLGDGSCAYADPRCCQFAGGTIVTGPVADCEIAPQACCFEQQGVPVCLDVNPTCCIERYAGTPQGPGTMCQGDGNGNGVDDACEPPPEVCPLPTAFSGQLCAPLQTQQCQTPQPQGQQCWPQTIISQGGGNIVVEQCRCFGQGICGSIEVQQDATGFRLTCPPGCPPGAACVIHIDGNATTSNTVHSSNVPAGSTVTCRCYIP